MITLKTWYLEIGMYVDSLDRSWAATPLLKKSFMITEDLHIQYLQKYCRTVVIDEEKSDPVIKKTLLSYYRTHVSRQDHIWKHITHYQKEYNLRMADEIYKTALSLLREIWDDFKERGTSDAFKIKKCVILVLDEMHTNPDAMALLGTLKSKQQDTSHHSLNVCILSVLLGRHLGVTRAELFDLAYGALLHDIGEVKMPQVILDKHHRGLSLEEKKILEEHTKYGVELLSTIPDISKTVLAITRSHHERVNGKGYPDGLENIDINYFAKMVAIVNAYEIVINHPKTKSPLSCTDTLKSIYMMRDNYFDTDLVEEFIKCLGTYPIGSVVELTNNEVAIVISSKPEKRLYPIVMVVKDDHEELLKQPEIVNLAPLATLRINRILPSTAIDGIDPSEYMVKKMGIDLVN